MTETYLEWSIDQQDQLKKALIELSKNGPDKEDEFINVNNGKIGDKIIEIYKSKYDGDKPFRHQYSLFLSILNEVKDEDLDIMMKNLKDILNENEGLDVYFKLLKLYDHLNIDIARKNIYKNLDEYKEQIADIEASIDEYTEDMNKLAEESSNYNIRMVTILGIFAAIVLSFSGGLTFITGSLGNIGDVNTFELVFFILLTGLILYNLLLLLLSVIEKAAKFSLLTTDKMYRRMVLGFNMMLIVGIIIDIAIWVITDQGLI